MIEMSLRLRSPKKNFYVEIETLDIAQFFNSLSRLDETDVEVGLHSHFECMVDEVDVWNPELWNQDAAFESAVH